MNSRAPYIYWNLFFFVISLFALFLDLWLVIFVSISMLIILFHLALVSLKFPTYLPYNTLFYPSIFTFSSSNKYWVLVHINDYHKYGCIKDHFPVVDLTTIMTQKTKAMTKMTNEAISNPLTKGAHLKSSLQ